MPKYNLSFILQNLIPKRMRGYLAVLIASVRKFGRMNNQIKRLVKVLLSLKMAESVNRKANIHIVNNLGHMTRSLRVLKSAIPRLASSVVMFLISYVCSVLSISLYLLLYKLTIRS